ncbi:MAG: hypothetical protein ACOVSW_12740 [Candidatus Kapaibacteriota bacterium]
MIETNIFEQWLDAEATRVGQKLANNENLTPDDKLTIVIKGLTNHVAHLDVDLRGEIIGVQTKIDTVRSELKAEISDFRSEVNKRFEKLEADGKDLRKEVIDIHKALNGQVWKIVGALSLIGSAAGAVGYLPKLWR